MTLRTLRFDNGLVGDLASSWSFARNAATRDGNGSEVSADSEAYAKQNQKHRWKTPVTPVTGSFGNTLIRGGYDLDGVTPLAIWADASDKNVKIYKGTGYTEKTSYTATVDGQVGSDIDWTAGQFQGSNRRYAGRAYTSLSHIVSYGTILMGCQRIESGTVQAEQLLYSQDYGQTWTEVTDTNGDLFPAFEASNDNERGDTFTMQTPFPVENNTDDPPLEQWVTFVDYANDPETNSKFGGRVWLLRMVRSSTADHWTVENARLVQSYDSNFDGDQHVHSAGVIDRTSQGYVLVISAWGDAIDDNRIELHKISLSNNDRSTYTTGSISHNTTFHASRDQDEANGVGAYGYQFVGVAPGPSEGELLLGNDESSLPLVILMPPDGDGLSEKARFRRVWGSLIGNGNNLNAFLIHSRVPHLRKDYVCTMQGARIGSLFSADGDHWSQFNESHQKDAAWYGDRIVSAGGSAINEWNKPEHRIGRPIQIAPGGLQLDEGQYVGQNGPDGNNTTEVLSRNGNGNFEFPSGHPRAGEELPEQPPTMADKLRHVQLVDSTKLGEYRVSDGQSGSTDLTGEMVLSFLVLEGSAGGANLIWSPGGGDPPNRRTRTVATNTWFSTHVRSQLEFGSEIATYNLQAINASPCDILVAVSYAASEKPSSTQKEIPYPLPLANSSSGTAYPDTIAKLTSIDVGGTWAVACHAQRPEHPWALGALPVPMFSIVEDADDYVTVTLDSSNGNITATLDVTVGGSSTTSTTSEAGNWIPGCHVSAVVTRLGNGSTELRLVGNNETIVSTTVAAEITGSQLDVKLCDEDEDAVGRFDYWELDIEDERNLSAAAKDRLIGGDGWQDQATVPSAPEYL